MILFVCNGNVARSQIAEELYKSITHKNASSAGTKVKPEKNGVLLKNDGEFALTAIDNFDKLTGIDISNNTRKMLTEDMMRLAEKIIIMADKDTLPDYISAYDDKIEYLSIRDPKTYDFDGYKDIIEQIRKYIEGKRE
jgi:protein-tyrosine-phosphatase